MKNPKSFLVGRENKLLTRRDVIEPAAELVFVGQHDMLPLGCFSGKNGDQVDGIVWCKVKGRNVRYKKKFTFPYAGFLKQFPFCRIDGALASFDTARHHLPQSGEEGFVDRPLKKQILWFDLCVSKNEYLYIPGGNDPHR